MAHTDTTPASNLNADEILAVQNLRLARRHATLLERLGVLSLIAGALFVLVLGPADELIAGLCLAAASVLVWAVLRAIALGLHLQVDRAVLVDDE